jgi:hypothetical protein
LVFLSITVIVNTSKPRTASSEAPMPAYARRDLVNDDQVGAYHCIARCVRRAFLCGADPYTGRDYNHRKKWVLNRLRQLAGVFGVEVGVYLQDTLNVATLKNVVTLPELTQFVLEKCGLLDQQVVMLRVRNPRLKIVR